jgi:hypothetical protein
VHFHLP